VSTFALIGLILLAILGGLRPTIVRGTSGLRRCPRCEYDLAGLDLRVTCPECGRRCAPDDFRPTPTRLRARPSLLAAADAALAGALMLALVPLVAVLTPLFMSLAVGAPQPRTSAFVATDLHRARLAIESALVALIVLTLVPARRPTGAMLLIALSGLVGGACAYLPAAIDGLMPDPRNMTRCVLAGLGAGALALALVTLLRRRSAPRP
jgi:hypothetical protein